VKGFLAAVTLAASLMFNVLPADAATFVQQPDPTAELIGTEVLLQAGLDRQTPKENGLAALVAECNRAARRAILSGRT
jgi:hypothetical protein